MSESEQAPETQRAGARGMAYRFIGAAVLVVLDLWSKAAVFAWLTPLEATGELERTCVHGHQRMHVLGEGVNWFSFMLSKNPGAAFGGFSGYPHLLVLGRVAAVLFLIWMLFRTPRGRPWFTLALVLVLGGALGNLYDNLFLIDPNTTHPYGEVRDFIDVYFARWDYHFPTFNVADSGITVGAVLLFLTSFAKEKTADDKGEGEAEAAGSVAQELPTE
jgi:signal peptidase II